MKILLGLITIFVGGFFWLFIYPERCQIPISISYKTFHEISNLSDALDNYERENSALPRLLQDLSPKYIQRLPEDSWGFGYKYVPDAARGLRIYSLGSDGKLGGTGTADDIYRNSDMLKLRNSIYKPVWGCNA